MDLEYVLESVSIEDKNIILEKIRKKELDVKFELWLFRPAESTGDGIGKKIKESAFGGDKGKLTNDLKITDNWDNIGKARIGKKTGEEIEIQSGFSTIQN